MRTKLLFGLAVFQAAFVFAANRAVVCGISEYAGGTYGQHCDADAKAVAQHLGRLGDWADAEIVLLTGFNATKAAINSAIDSMTAGASSNDVFIFFFSGRSASGVIYAYDGSITFNQLAQRIAYMPAGNYAIFIDMGLPASGSTTWASLSLVDYTNTDCTGISVLSYYQYLNDDTYPVAKNSPFTYLLLEGLCGYAASPPITAQQCASYIDPDNEYTRISDNSGGFAITAWPISNNDIYDLDTAVSNTVIPLDGSPLMRAIRPAAEFDFVRFTISQSDTVCIETNSTNQYADTKIELYKTSVAAANLIAENDDNPDTGLEDYYLSKITKTLDAGTYYVKIRHYDGTTPIESYTIRASLTEQQLYITGPDFLYENDEGGYKCYIDNPVSGAAVEAVWTSNAPEAYFTQAVLYTSQVAQDTEITVRADYNGASVQKNVVLRNSKHPAAAVQYYAVICGIADYPGTSNDLSFTVDDAKAFRNQLLKDPCWKSENITLLTNSAATYQGVYTAIMNMAAKAGSDDVCLFYYSGHGTAVTDSYPYDEADGLDECLYAYDQNIRDDVFAQWIGNLASDKYIVIIDSCYSGGQIKSAWAGIDKDFTKALGKNTAAKGDGFAADIGASAITLQDLNDNGKGVVLTACDDDETSWEISELSHGLFTYYLLEAMEGAGDTNGDGFVSVRECYEYMYSPVLAKKPQHIQIYDGGQASIPLKQYNAARYVSDVSISGQSAALEPMTGYDYTCTAIYSDGSTADITSLVEWRVDEEYGVISQNGSLTTGQTITADFTISALYNNLYLAEFDVSMQIKYGGGQGSEASPFVISSPCHLTALSGNPADWSSYFILTCDLDMSGIAFTPIGPSWNNSFNGVFDGGGHEIRNLTVDTGGGDYAGLFGQISSGGAIKNLGLVNVDIDSGAGNFAGAVSGWNNGKISRCFSTGQINGAVHVGGISGGLSGGGATIEDCYSFCDISAIDSGAGITGMIADGAMLGRLFAAGSVLSLGLRAPITNYYQSENVAGCFYDAGAFPYGNGAGVPLSAAQSKLSDVYIAAGWDFSAAGVWKIKNGYSPLLRWQADFLPGDFDGDGFVGEQDIFIIASQWLIRQRGLSCDISRYGGDGCVNLSDLAVMGAYWEQ